MDYVSERGKQRGHIHRGCSSFLYQHIQQNSRKRRDDVPSLIDLMFTDEAMHVSEVGRQSPYLDYTKPTDRYAYEKGYPGNGERSNKTDTNSKEEFIASANDKNIDELWESLKS